jgi:hypothetical protein
MCILPYTRVSYQVFAMLKLLLRFSICKTFSVPGLMTTATIGGPKSQFPKFPDPENCSSPSAPPRTQKDTSWTTVRTHHRSHRFDFIVTNNTMAITNCNKTITMTPQMHQSGFVVKQGNAFIVSLEGRFLTQHATSVSRLRFSCKCQKSAFHWTCCSYSVVFTETID